MPKNRDKFKQAALVAKRNREAKLDSIAAFGILDPTPKEAVNEIIRKQKTTPGSGQKTDCFTNSLIHRRNIFNEPII